VYIEPKSRTERPRKAKIGTEVAHVTRDSDTTFRSKVKGQGHQAALLIAVLAHQAAQRWAWEGVGRGRLLLRCRLLGGARPFGAHGRGDGRGILWRPPAYSLLSIRWWCNCIDVYVEWVGFNVPINRLQVISETSLSSQSLALVLTT